jgi:hypothetical protein
VTLRELVERQGLTCRFDYSEFWTIDFEYNSTGPGEPVWPLCLVARELRSRSEVRVWRYELQRMPAPPFNIGPRTLIITFAAWAEMQCFQVLGWPRPANVIDLHAEHRVETNGLIRPQRLQKNDLLTAARIRNLDTMESAEKSAMRELILSKQAFTPKEQERIAHYCSEDVRLTEQLFLKMLRGIDLKRALWRGRFGWPVAACQNIGVPIDYPLHTRLSHHWLDIKRILIRDLDGHGIFNDASFNEKLFDRRVVQALKLPWPRHPSGHLVLDDDAFEAMARLFLVVRPIRELRRITGKMRKFGLTVSERDHHNRFLITPFQTKTGRNAPSNSAAVFGLGAWLRHLITPRPGTVLLYCDWSSQEYVIMAAKSGDELMLDDCAAPDPYIRFGQRLGRLPEGATKKTHPTLREQFKVSALATFYGQTEHSLAPSLNISLGDARHLLDQHAKLYARCHRWLGDFVAGSRAAGLAWTSLGWVMRLSHLTNRRTLMNFPAQAHGAELLRAAMILLEERGIRVCTPVHDAVLVECLEEEAEATAETVRAIMTKAAVMLLGVAPRVSITPIAFGERLVEARGVAMWNRVLGALQETEAREREVVPVHRCTGPR